MIVVFLLVIVVVTVIGSSSNSDSITDSNTYSNTYSHDSDVSSVSSTTIRIRSPITITSCIPRPYQYSYDDY